MLCRKWLLLLLGALYTGALFFINSYVYAKPASDLAGQGLRGKVFKVEVSTADVGGSLSLTDVYNVRGYRISASRSVNNKLADRSITLYDTKGKLVRTADITFGTDGKPTSDHFYDCLYTYTPQGDLKQAVSYKFNGLIEQKSILTYTNGSNGKKTKAEEAVYYGSGKLKSRRTCRYMYDSKGRLSQEVWSNPTGTILSKHIYGYDNKGRKIKETVQGSTGAVSHTLTWKYDKSGHLIEETYKAAKSNWQRQWTYDFSGKETGHTYRQNGSLVQTSKYDPKKKTTTLVSYGSAGKLIEVIDTKSKVVSSSSYMRSGRLVSEKKYTYRDDAKGNWTSRTIQVIKGEDKGSVKKEQRKITYYSSGEAASVYEVFGRVADDKGRAVSNATITARFSDGTSKVYRTDNTGIWFADDLKGRVTVSVQKKGLEFKDSTISDFSPSLLLTGKPASAKGTGETVSDSLREKDKVNLQVVPSLNLPDATLEWPALAPGTIVRIDKGEAGLIPNTSIVLQADRPAEPINADRSAVEISAMPEFGFVWSGSGKRPLPTGGIRFTAKAGHVGASAALDQVSVSTNGDGADTGHWFSLSAQYSVIDTPDLRVSLGGGLVRKEYQEAAAGVSAEGAISWYPKDGLDLALNLNMGYSHYLGNTSAGDNTYVKASLTGSPLAILASSIICALTIGFK